MLFATAFGFNQAIDVYAPVRREGAACPQTGGRRVVVLCRKVLKVGTWMKSVACFSVPKPPRTRVADKQVHSAVWNTVHPSSGIYNA